MTNCSHGQLLGHYCPSCAINHLQSEVGRLRARVAELEASLHTSWPTNKRSGIPGK